MSPGRFLALFFALAVFSSGSVAQKLDAALTLGGTFTSDASELVAGTCLTQCSPTERFSTNHDLFFAATGAFRLANFKLVSFHLEVPVELVDSAPVTRTNVFGTPFPDSETLSSLFLTPSLRLKLAPGARISPFGSIGGGWARYKLSSVVNNKGALQFGGGVDIKTGLPLLAFRAEVRDFVTGQPDFGAATLEPPGSQPVESRRHNVLAGGGIVLQF